MAMRKTVLAMLMCAVFVAVFAAPLVQSEAGDVNIIYKDENGPPSTCALTWYMNPEVNGIWYGHVINYGMRWIILDMVDQDTDEIVIDREMYRFAEWGNEFDTPSVEMTAGHTYMITGTPNGPLGTTITVEDVFEGYEVPNEPPVALFTVSVDGDTVTVDASASYDTDGAIVSWAWDWDDGTFGSGEVATHTYTVPDTKAALAVRDTPIPPWNVMGQTLGPGGEYLSSTVTVTNMRTMLSGVVMSDSSYYGFYEFDMNLLDTVNGDTIHVEAVSGDYFGEAEGIADKLVSQYLQLDVLLSSEEPPPQPFEFVIILTVTDDDGATDTISVPVTVYL